MCLDWAFTCHTGRLDSPGHKCSNKFSLFFFGGGGGGGGHKPKTYAFCETPRMEFVLASQILGGGGGGGGHAPGINIKGTGTGFR